MSYLSDLSSRIKQVRLEATGKKLSQDEFARRMNMTRSMVQNMEDAESRLSNGIPDRVLKAICATYHVNYLWLTQGMGPMLEENIPAEETDEMVERTMPNADPGLKALVKAFCKMPDEDWNDLKALVERIKKGEQM